MSKITLFDNGEKIALVNIGQKNRSQRQLKISLADVGKKKKKP